MPKRVRERLGLRPGQPCEVIEHDECVEYVPARPITIEAQEFTMSFLPAQFEPPSACETTRFRIRPITIHDVFKDYDAVMSNREHLWGRFGSMWGWPAEDLTLEQDMIDLAWHQKEAQLRSSFNYAVMSLDDSTLLGCVYVDPPELEQTEADIWFWSRRDRCFADQSLELATFVPEWLERSWPFDVVAISGSMVRLRPSAVSNAGSEEAKASR